MTKLDEWESEGYAVEYNEYGLIIYPKRVGKAEMNYHTTPPALFIFWKEGGFNKITIDYDIGITIVGKDSSKTYTAVAGIGLYKVVVYVFNPMEVLMNISTSLMVFQSILQGLVALGGMI